MRALTILAVLATAFAALSSGCSRTHYFVDADAETYAVLDHTTTGTLRQLPYGFSVVPDPRSRLFDPTPIVDPMLPKPAPQLYAYDIPLTVGRERLLQVHGERELDTPYESVPAGDRLPVTVQPVPDTPVASPSPATPPVHAVTRLPPVTPELTRLAGTPVLRPTPGYRPSRTTTSPVALASFEGAVDAVVQPVPSVDAQQPPEELPQPPTSREQRTNGTTRGTLLPTIPISSDNWETLPESCLQRMLEFESVRTEYQSTYQDQQRQAGTSPQPSRHDLEALVSLGLLNSREYQTQKEILYETALALTLTRFDYALKFNSSGNGTDLNYNHNRSGGTTVNSLGIPTNAGVNKMLNTGGTILASFVNDVVLTFNGANGFSTDIGSDLLFSVTQTFLQRDVLFEPLTQAERNVIYAARTFARFRKTFFFGVASDYYSLLQNYRQIEIEAQNYISLVRAYDQAAAEERVGLQSLIQVEQIEQNVLSGRSRLISTCVSLERALDQFKISLGLPTEIDLNLDLAELEQLTASDEAAVGAEQVRRAVRRATRERDKLEQNQDALLNVAIVLIERLIDWTEIQGQLNQPLEGMDELSVLYAVLRVEEARLRAANSQNEYESELRQTTPPPPIRVFQRVITLVDALLEIEFRQLAVMERVGVDPSEIDAAWQAREQLVEDARALRERLAANLGRAQLEGIPILTGEAEQLLQRVRQRVARSEQIIAAAGRTAGQENLEELLTITGDLLGRASELLAGAEGGLVPIEIEVDDAMMTALTQRLDLMNERGFLADDWRSIKYAADDLKSVLNLDASTRVGTTRNRAFGFNAENSSTNVRFEFDAPLNRKAQRNDFRRELIDYQAALRSLMAFEDSVKFDVRDNLRSLSLDRLQYDISVASAALAAERVRSTRLELSLGFPGVAARDFLEAQDAYRQALSGVASNHIGFQVDRMRFFLDLELMQVNDDGFWPFLYDEEYQPEPQYSFPVVEGSPYGPLDPKLWYSPKIRRMVNNAPPPRRWPWRIFHRH